MSDNTSVSYTDQEIEENRLEILEERLISLVEEELENENLDNIISDEQLRVVAKRRLKDPAIRERLLKQYHQVFQPGTYDCHEVLIQAQNIQDFINGTILEHDTVVGNPHWFNRIKRLSVEVFNIIQEIGLVHAKAQPDNIIDLIEHKKLDQT